ncbi:RNase H1/viroplasmin domain-containing protein [Selenomonas sp. AB3002]|uniref:ribonuclease H1 domain-containing protein n=1 Tax=Selenomonas sp. AB3002 TaxID=1392502 RepID=UPI0004951E40
MAKKFYAVANGRKTGIFELWAEADRQVKGFTGARYKGFNTREEAEKFLEESKAVYKVDHIYAVARGRVPEYIILGMRRRHKLKDLAEQSTVNARR